MSTDFDPLWTPSLWTRIIAQILCLCALDLCCRRQLTRWRAFSQATPPTTITKETPKEAQAQSLLQKCATVAFLGLGIVMPATSMYSLYNKDWAPSQWMIDAPWAGMMLYCWTTTSTAALQGLFPRQRILTFIRGRGDREKQWDMQISPAGSANGWFNWNNESVNFAAGLACSIALLGSRYLGYRHLMPVAIAAQVISSHLAWYTAKIRMKRVIQLEGAIVVLAAIIIGIVSLIPSKKSTGEPIKPSKANPSQWVFDVMNLIAGAMAYNFAGVFMIVNTRYEHSRVASPRLPHPPGQGVPLDHKARLPFMPLHYVPFVALGACCALVDLLQWTGAIITHPMVDVGIIAATGIPATIGACALYTLVRGDFKDWWKYTENYHPDINFENLTILDEDKKVIEPEKRPLTP